MIKINTLYGLERISDCYYITSEREIINADTNKIKTQTLGKRGYYYVSLSEKDTNRQVKVTVHKIIALAFIKNAPYIAINHKDGNKLNNDPNNLEFCTQRENVLHAWKNGLIVRKERVFRIEFLNYYLDGTIKQLTIKSGIPKATLYDLFYKKKGSKLYGIIKIIEVIDNEGQETIEMVNPA